MSESSARQRFVKAMRWIRGHDHRYLKAEIWPDQIQWIRCATDAFADAECLNADTRGCDLLERNHATCRAILRREIGLE